MDAIVAAAKVFQVRPSSLLAIEDTVLALDFDLAAARRVLMLQQEAGEKSEPVERLVL